MTTTQTAYDLVEKIAKKSGKTEKEIKEKIDEKKAKFSGLLTDEGAAFMLSKELGIELRAGENKRKLNDLKDGDSGVNLSVRVMHVFSPKKFEKNGKQGTLCNAIVADDTKEMRLTFWHDDAKKLFEEKIERNAMLELSNVSVSSYNEQKQLSIGFGGAFWEINDETHTLPAAKEKPVKLKELEPNQNNVDVFAKISRIFPERQFESNGKTGKVINFEIADETKAVRAAAWNEIAEYVKKLSSGQTVKIEGAYTKDGLNGVELNLGWQARIIENPKNVRIEKTATDFETKKIDELGEFMNAKVKAKIKTVENGKLHYFVCPDCGKKLERDAEEFNCLTCKETKNPDINLVVALMLEEGQNRIRTVLFGKQAEKAISVSKDEMKKLLEEKNPEEIVHELNEKLAGKEITVQGTVRKNNSNDENELIVQSVIALTN